MKKGDKVTLRKLAPTTTHELPDAEWRARVLHEDEHLLVIDKPTGERRAARPWCLPWLESSRQALLALRGALAHSRSTSTPAPPDVRSLAGLASAPTPSDPYNAVSALEEFLARRDGKPTT